MKRIILLAALLLAASACTTTTQAPSNANTTTTPANANASATPRADANTTDNPAIAKEKEIWETIKKKDWDGFAAMLADDFVYVTNTGLYDRAAAVEGLRELEVTDVSFSDWKVVMLDKDAALVTYTVNMKGTSGGEPVPARPVYGSSAWINRNGKWVGVFHQDTEAKETPPTAGATTATPASSTEARPAATAITPAADHIAREKQVWDAIKRKDFDGFASLLADDQIEVSEWGVNDKAASVKGVQQADLSKASQSDFRQMKLSENAVLVTYMVRGPSPPFAKDGERDSTIWVNRGGKWLAAFHQGTPVQPAMATSKK